jgi:D-3-phosphoglycerate dehydrogenase
MITGNKILVIDSIHPAFNEILEKHGFEVTDGTAWSLDELKSRIILYNGIAIRSRFAMNEGLLSFATALKFIARAGAGMENIDLAYAASRNITCLNAPEGNRDAVGEHAIAMLLALMNNLIRADREVRNDIWKREENRGRELEGKTVGVIGYGNMGTSFVQKLAGFGVKVLIYDKYKTVDTGAYYRNAAMQELFEQSDVISLHIPLTQETEYLVNAAFINSFKKSFYFINTSRGKNVSTADLVNGIREGKISGAALDVLEYENTSFESLDPNLKPEPLRFLLASDKVVLSPHIAGWTYESGRKIAVTLAHKILKLYNLASPE